MRPESQSGKRFPRRYHEFGRRQAKATPIPGVAFFFYDIVGVHRDSTRDDRSGSRGACD